MAKSKTSQTARSRRRPVRSGARKPVRAAPDRGRRPPREPEGRLQVGQEGLRAGDRQRQGPGQGRHFGQEGPEGDAPGRRGAAGGA